MHFVVVRPPVGLKTADVFGACRVAGRARSLDRLLGALGRGDLSAAGRLLWNRLQPAAESLSPWIRRLRTAMTRHDVLGHQLTGSGTCYFGICRHARHARRVARCLQGDGVGAVFTARISR
jgi:4-diphosphocytidyl-2-C-methyl-D-erythritol kinase